LADCLLEKDERRSYNESENAQTLYGSAYQLDKKEREVIKFLNGNPGSTKEDVVKGLKGKFSRVTVFDAIDVLLEKGIIVNNRKGKGRNRLYVKHEEEILSIQENLGAFQFSYSELIDEMISIFQLKLSGKENQKEERALIHLLSKIIKLYKFLCTVYITSDIFLWHKRPLDNGILHAKFELFFNTMKEIHNKLCEMLTKVGIEHKRGVEIVYTILYNGEWSFSAGELSSMLKSFNKNGLGNYFEYVVDAIWVLSYPILPLIDPFYGKHYKSGTLRDWRNLFKASNTLHYSPITKQLLVPEEY
jgi:Fe2+ or Zn2+ uptake regulation protein